MDQISEYINFPNQKIHSYDKMRNIVFNLGSKKGENNENYSPQLTCLKNQSLMSIFDIPEND